MKKLVILALLMCLSLTGCGKSDTVEPVPESPVETVETKTKPTETKEEPPEEYAKDNIGGQGDNKYNSGIYVSDVEVQEPYKYSGEVINNSEVEDIDEKKETVAIWGSELYKLQERLSLFKDTDTGELIVNLYPEESMEDATKRTQTEVDALQVRIDELIKQGDQLETVVPETEVPEEQLETLEPIETPNAATDLREIIIDGIYTNGVSLLNDIKSVEDFNLKHKVDIDSVVLGLRSNLENLEYCDTLIKENLGSNKNVVSIWKDLKPMLIKWRQDISGIHTGKEYIEAKILADKAFVKKMGDFSKAVSSLSET